MTMPALALVGASGRIQYCTEPFRTRCERAGSLCEGLPELEAVLSGGVDRADVTLDGLHTHVEAVLDAGGSRCALLTLAIDAEHAHDAENPILREPLDESPAILWLKDLEGRHMRVNRQFLAVLGGSEEQLTGRTDAELPPGATVDGPRLQDAERSASEPLEFGYTVPAYQDRPALSVVRFLVHGADGEPVAVCGVAAPMAHSEIAEDEAARLMQLNRWSSGDAASIRADVLEEWGVRLVDGSPDDAASWGSGPEEDGPAAPAGHGEVEQAVVVARDGDDAELATELAAATAARDEATAARNEAVSARDEALSARAALEDRVRSLEEQLVHAARGAEPGMEHHDGDAADAIAIAREEADEARAQAEAARAEAASARAEAESLRVQLGGAQGEIEAARREADAARAEATTAWSEAETERTNAGLLAGQLADTRRQLQHQRAQTALAQQQLQIPRCSAAAQASRPASQHGRRIEAAQIALRARKPAAQPLDPTLMSKPAPTPVGADASGHGGSQRGGLLGRLRPRGRH